MTPRSNRLLGDTTQRNYNLPSLEDFETGLYLNLPLKDQYSSKPPVFLLSLAVAA